MTELRLTNTLSRRKEVVTPQNPDGILRMYHCGPTVYGTPHLGNLRRFLVADLLVRTARFLGYRVRSVMNLTDVGHLLDPTPLASGELRGAGPTSHPSLREAHGGQDRILVAAQREGRSPEQIAAKYTAEFFHALVALRAEPADYYPRATMHVPQMQEIIRRLLGKGYAYETPTGIYYDISKYPRYGELSGNTLASLQAGARVEKREEKRHPADFALWVKALPEHLLQWDSPWGRGYPGWHIECSAMSMQVLGETIDIHTGGKDNIFPHHENEIAQSEGATGKPFVRTWVHNEFLELSGAKMAKSEGGTLTLADVTARGGDPLAFRLLALQTHYRSTLHFSWEALEGAATALGSLRDFVGRLQRSAAATNSEVGPPAPRLRRAGGGTSEVGATLAERLQTLEQNFTKALADDLGSPQALAAVFEFLHEVNPRLEAGTLTRNDVEALRATLRKLDTVLGLLDVDAPFPSPALPTDVQALVNQREEARRKQGFATADRLRADIQAKGYVIEDTPQGPRVKKL